MLFYIPQTTSQKDMKNVISRDSYYEITVTFRLQLYGHVIKLKLTLACDIYNLSVFTSFDTFF